MEAAEVGITIALCGSALQSARERLESEGFQVARFDSRASALAPGEEGFCVIALLDADELGDDAREVVRRLARMRSVRPIVVSSSARPETIVEIVRAGAVDYVVRDSAGEFLHRLSERLRVVEKLLRNGELGPTDRFLKIMSSLQHDVKNPINNILGYVELLLDYSEDPLSEDQRHFLTRVRANCETALEILDMFSAATTKLMGG